MNYSNHSANSQNEYLGVNKMGRNIKKAPNLQPNFANPGRQQPQPHVYNINKNDFRNFVQQVTGSPSRESEPRPPQPPKPSSIMRLQKVRPPPLNPINLPNYPIHPAPPPPQVALPNPNPNPNLRPSQFGQLSPTMFPPMSPGDLLCGNTAESPISAFMRYLQTSTPTPRQTQPQFTGPIQAQPPLVPSPSQYPFPSPTGFSSIFSPILSPRYQFPRPQAPNFSFSPLPRSGLLSPMPQQHPFSPGVLFPTSPLGYFPILSPRWRE